MLTLQKYRPDLKFFLLTDRFFIQLWRLGFLRKKWVFFSTWRILYDLIKRKPGLIKDQHFSRFLGAVTSHSNIGGGLDESKVIPSIRSKEETYTIAINFLQKFKVVTVNSRILETLLRKDIGDTLFYCPNGVDESFYRPQNTKNFTPENIMIGTSGTRRSAKNFEVLEALQDDVKKDPGIQLDILSLSKDIRHVPRTAEGMVQYYHDLDFYLCASTNEGTPNPALEAAACGVPVITTRVGNMPELINDGINGYFVDPTKESIFDAFQRLKGIPVADYQNMSQKIRESIESDWTWDKRIVNFSNALDSLVG